MKKFNIGSPKRPGKTKSKTAKRTIYKKHNIGPPGKVIVTPDTPRSKEWVKNREKSNYKSYEIGKYEPDKDDKKVLENDPQTYTTFEETVTPFMKEALIKTPFTRSPKGMGTQVHKSDEAWKKKRDHSPNELHLEPENLITRKKHRQSRTRTKGRGRTRSRSRRSRG
jgi:hypothetical protein